MAATAQREEAAFTPMLLSGVKKQARNLPNRLVMHGVEGVGKTSFAQGSHKPITLMSSGETGLETLITAGQLEEVAHMPEIHQWLQLLSILDQLRDEDHDYRTVVLDTFNGFERLCFEHVCRTQYKGNFGKDGFFAYQEGPNASLTEWRRLLFKLDQLRERKKGMSVIVLCHSRVNKFSNPEGQDYHRYIPDMHEKVWGLSHKWADIVLFANYHQIVVSESKKPTATGKAKGGTQRVAYAERTAAFDAKNRHGLSPSFSLGSNHEEAWANFILEMKGDE